jgi:hypothetical protein
MINKKHLLFIRRPKPKQRAALKRPFCFGKLSRKSTENRAIDHIKDRTPLTGDKLLSQFAPAEGITA